MLEKFERYPLTFGPTPIEKLDRLGRHLGGKVEALRCRVSTRAPRPIVSIPQASANRKSRGGSAVLSGNLGPCYLPRMIVPSLAVYSPNRVRVETEQLQSCPVRANSPLWQSVRFRKA